MQATGSGQITQSTSQNDQPTIPFLMTYFGIRPEKRLTIQKTAQGPNKSRTNSGFLGSIVQNIFGSGSDLDRKTGLRMDDDTTLSDPLEDVSLGITTSSRVSKFSDENAQGSDVNQSCFIRDVFLVLKEALFNVWTEENDPTYYYYPSIKSHTDHDLLNH